MIQFFVQRSLHFILTCLLAWTLVFIVLHIAPGDAIAAQLAGSAVTPEQLAERRTALGLNRPIMAQWLDSLVGLVRGDLGISLSSNRPVGTIIGEQWGATVELAVSAFLVSLCVGVGSGLLSVSAQYELTRRIAQFVTVFALSSPLYWIGVLAIYFFSVWLRVLPSTSGGGDLRGLILPAGVLGFGLSGTVGRVTAASLRETLTADYVRQAYAKGLTERIILWRHVLRVSLPPIMTVAGLQIGFLLGGAAITEALFVRPGVGRVLINAINEKDYPVVQGIVLLGAFIYSLSNLAADLLSALVDPRLRHA